MIRSLQLIHGRLFHANPLALVDQHKTDHVIRFLQDQEKINPTETVFRELINNINKLRVQEVSPIYIERFCLSKISEVLLQTYPLNIGEAYALAYIRLNHMVELNLLHFKLGESRLLTPALINGQRVEDVEAISQFIIKSLADAGLIKITENRYVLIGPNFKADP